MDFVVGLWKLLVGFGLGLPHRSVRWILNLGRFVDVCSRIGMCLCLGL